MFEKLKRFFTGEPKEKKKQELPEIPWIPADKNQWKVPILDVRPVTQTMLSTSTNKECAVNAISYGQDDGTGFTKQEPEDKRIVAANLKYRIDRILAPGALFVPRVMEHKWALYFHEGRILCIRSWQRKVVVTARVECADGYATVESIHGAFVGEKEDDDFTVRILDYLLRTHALGLPFPAPVPLEMANHPSTCAMWCMNIFGNMAFCATPHKVDTGIPDKPLRTHSLLHIAVARADIQAADRLLKSGLPADLLAGDGLAPLHWAFACKDTAMAEYLIQCGSPVDVRSAEGATPLMNTAQAGEMAKITFLLDHGADVNAADLRGFTSLHRVAEVGNLEVTRLLLDRGAHAGVVAQGHSPLSLAEKRGHAEIVKLLQSKG